MTRGKRMNHIRLSGPAPKMANSEFVMEGSDTGFIDQLVVSGRISYGQHRAARTIMEDHAKGSEAYEDAMASLSHNAQRHIEAMLIDRITPFEHGRNVQGYRQRVEAEEWALQRLKASLEELTRLYNSERRGVDDKSGET